MYISSVRLLSHTYTLHSPSRSSPSAPTHLHPPPRPPTSPFNPPPTASPPVSPPSSRSNRARGDGPEDDAAARRRAGPEIGSILLSNLARSCWLGCITHSWMVCRNDYRFRCQCAGQRYAPMPPSTNLVDKFTKQRTNSALNGAVAFELSVRNQFVLD